MKDILELIKEFEQIVLFRHVNPDFDAYGSQAGLCWTLKQMYPDKNIVVEGVIDGIISRYFNLECDTRKDNVPTLAIVCDTANRERIDGNTEGCDKVIKIDHHIVVDSYGDLNIEVETSTSACEIITLLLQEENISIPLDSAKALYIGIVGDSNRFMYSSTSKDTFKAASYLLDQGINIEEIYRNMYVRKLSDLKVTQFVYANYQYQDGIAWYYMSADDLNQLGITRNEGSGYVNVLSNVEEFKVWFCITENVEENTYRVSLRSRDYSINTIAEQFNGGGHKLASGCTLESLDDLERLLSMIKEVMNNV